VEALRDFFADAMGRTQDKRLAVVLAAFENGLHRSINAHFFDRAPFYEPA
jgi:hypothetical protein